MLETFRAQSPGRRLDENPSSSNVWAETAFACFMLTGYLLAWSNLRRGRSDRHGSLRIAMVIFAMRLLEWLLSAHHVGSGAEFAIFWGAFAIAVFFSANVAVFYLAVEPYVRRRRPHVLIDWVRALEGRLRDPLVASHILAGAAVGSVLALTTSVQSMASAGPPSTASLDAALSTFRAAGTLVGQLGESIVIGLGFCFLFVALSEALRSEWLGGTAAAFLFGVFDAGDIGPITVATLGVGIVMGAALTALMVRAGLTAVIAQLFVTNVLRTAPLTLNPTTWFAGVSGFTACVILALAATVAYFSIDRQAFTRESRSSLSS